jgi:hypothetical protein
MDKSEIEANNKARKCAGSTDVTDPNGCLEDCKYDKKLKRCIPKDPVADPSTSFGKFMDGKKYLTFRSNKKPAFSFRIPINADTLFGKYSGAIRFAPSTGKLHLCYGPLSEQQAKQVGANRPVLSMLVKPKLSENLWTWYLSSGKNMQKKRMRELVGKDNVSYTDIYALPGASYQLSYTEANFLEATCLDIEAKRETGDLPFGLKAEDIPNDANPFFRLANAPTTCPSVLNGVNPADTTTGCLESLEFGGKGMDDLSDDEDYNQLAVLGHEPNKKQKELVSDSDDDDSGKKAKKAKKAKDVVRSPVPERFREHLDDINKVLTTSLAKERDKAFEDKANLEPETRILKDVFKYVIEAPTGRGSRKGAFLRKGYEQTNMFAELNQIIAMWDKSLYAMDFVKGIPADTREMLVGGELNRKSTQPDSDEDLGWFYDMGTFSVEELDQVEEIMLTTGVASVIDYLTNVIPTNKIPVCEVDGKTIKETSIPITEAETRQKGHQEDCSDPIKPPRSKQYAMDFVQRLLLLHLFYISHDTPEGVSQETGLRQNAPHLIKCSFIVSLCLAWLKAFRTIYKPRDGTSMALTMDSVAFANFAGEMRRDMASDEDFKEKYKNYEIPKDIVKAGWPDRVPLFPFAGIKNSDGKMLSPEALYGAKGGLKDSLKYLTQPLFRKITVETMGSSGLTPPYDVSSMFKSSYKFSDARCESMLLELDTQPSRAYRSTTKNVSRRARARARQYLSNSDSSDSDSD